MDIFKELKVKLIEELHEYDLTQTKGKFLTQIFDAGVSFEEAIKLIDTPRGWMFENLCYRTFPPAVDNYVSWTYQGVEYKEGIHGTDFKSEIRALLDVIGVETLLKVPKFKKHSLPGGKEEWYEKMGSKGAYIEVKDYVFNYNACFMAKGNKKQYQALGITKDQFDNQLNSGMRQAIKWASEINKVLPSNNKIKLSFKTGWKWELANVYLGK
jgi:hypothetical protein